MQNGRASRCRARLTRPSREQFANLAAGDRFAAQRHLGIHLDLKAHLMAEFGEQVHVSRGLVAKAEVESLVHFAGMQLVSSGYARQIVAASSARDRGVKGSSSTASMPVLSSKRNFSGVGVSSFNPESGRRIRVGCGSKRHRYCFGPAARERAHDFGEHMRDGRDARHRNYPR